MLVPTNNVVMWSCDTFNCWPKVDRSTSQCSMQLTNQS
uniref:Uncharacterized protein n=1 Tax=Arundo donax TaxID=35708 RepID=A0A0A9BP93_ARUDO